MNDDAQTVRPPRSGFHPVSIGHLVMGLALLGLVAVWALIESGAAENDDLKWLLPIPWVVAGVVGLMASALTGSQRHASRQTGWVGPPTRLTDPASEPPGSLLTDPQDPRAEPVQTEPVQTEPVTESDDANQEETR